MDKKALMRLSYYFTPVSLQRRAVLLRQVEMGATTTILLYYTTLLHYHYTMPRSLAAAV